MGSTNRKIFRIELELDIANAVDDAECRVTEYYLYTHEDGKPITTGSGTTIKKLPAGHKDLSCVRSMLMDIPAAYNHLRECVCYDELRCKKKLL